jgi:hypothetical protein
MRFLRRTRGVLVLASFVVPVFVTIAACGDDDAAAIDTDAGSDRSVPDATADTNVAPDAPVADAEAGVDFEIDPLGTDDQAVSGTRIKAVRYRTADGVRWLARLHDVQLDLRCELARASDGKIRCLPRVGGEVFLGADCTGTKGVMVEACASSAYTSEAPTCGLDGARTVRKLGAATADTVVYRMAGAQCIALPLASDQAFRPIGDVEPPESFAEAQTLVDFPSSPSAAQRTVVKLARTSDGATAKYSLWDRGTDSACRLHSADEKYQCYPLVASVTASLFVDDTCTTRAGSVDTRCADPKIGLEINFLPDGGSETHLFPVGARVDGGIHQQTDPTTCQAYPSTGGVYVTVGTELQPNPFNTGTVLVAGGPRRLRRTSLDFGELHDIVTGGFTDSATNDGCQAFLTGPTTAICGYGGGGFVVDVFADSTCTQAIRVARVDTPGATIVWDRLRQCASGPTAPYATVGAARTQNHWTKVNGVCKEVTTGTFAEVGAPPDLSKFETLTLEP